MEYNLIQMVVYSGVDMMAISTAFRGFASISGTADTDVAQQFASTVKTDAGVLDDKNVKTSLVNRSGRPIELQSDHFTSYEKWYDNASDEDQSNWGDSENFSYKHSGNSFYTAMKEHQVHFGGGFNLWVFLGIKESKVPRSLSLSDDASVTRTKIGTPSDAEIIAMFDPYARAHGESFNSSGKSMAKTIPSISVNTTEPATPNEKKADAGEYNYGIMFAANDVYTATAGDTHESVMYLSHVASSVKWYVDTTLIETDNNTDEPRMSWSIPEDASGDYVIKAEVTPNMTSSYEASYTLSVTAKTPVETSSSTSSTLSNSLVSSDGVYTAEAGDSHTASLSVPLGWTSIYWYLKSPSESGLGTSQSSVSDSPGNSTTASYTYSFPSGVSGDYVLTAYTTLSDNTVVQPSYTVSVSLPVPIVFIPSLSLRYNSSTSVVSMTATANQPIYGADLYVRSPGDTSNKYGTKIRWTFGNSNRTTYVLPVSYTFPSTAASGSYQFTLRVYPFNDSRSGDAWGTSYDVSENVTVQ